MKSDSDTHPVGVRPAMTPPVSSAHGHAMNARDERSWFVMTSPEPKAVEASLLRENSRRRAEGREAFHYFVPYQFLERRIAEDAFDAGDADDPKSKASVSGNNSMRAALRRYVFIKSCRSELDALLGDDATRDAFRTLWWLRDRNRHRVTVPAVEMEQFINACCDMRVKFEICPPDRELHKNEPVRIRTGCFEGRKAWIVDVKRRSDGTQELVCGFCLFGDTAMVKLRHLSPEDVIVRPDKSPGARSANSYRLIEDIQRKVFALMAHRIDPMGLPDVTLRKDDATLELLNSFRYRRFDTFALRARHCALMLLCIMLSGDSHALRRFVAVAHALLAEAESKPAGKVPHDVTAYLRSALYIVTADLSHYEAARRYFITQPRLSGPQRQMIYFMENRDRANLCCQ